jgi:hypothetical protein
MKASLLLACGTALLAPVVAVACAASGNDVEAAAQPDGSGNSPVMPDGAVPEVDGGPDVPDGGPLCSKAGWCVTSLPDTDLIMKDIWPLSGRAFAVAESPTLGIKVLEWEDADAKWTYIDDKSQNLPGFGKYVGKIWAPNENEVYFGVAPGYVFHGTRPAPPETAWSWTRHRLDHSHVDIVEAGNANPTYWTLDMRYPALGVWGSSSNDVYAWFANTIYRWKSVDGGAPEWAVEYAADDADDPSEHLFFVGAGGTGPDDVWFSGARSRTSAGCALVVRKSPAGYQRVADGFLFYEYEPCEDRGDGSLMIGGPEGWLTDIQSLAPNEVIGLKGARDVVRISVDGDSYSVTHSPVPQEVIASGLSSLWGGPGNLWLSGWGRVARGTDVWDGGGYQLSTISLIGGPIDRPMYQVRGTSNTNLWAIGVRYALHKTTP